MVIQKVCLRMVPTCPVSLQVLDSAQRQPHLGRECSWLGTGHCAPVCSVPAPSRLPTELLCASSLLAPAGCLASVSPTKELHLDCLVSGAHSSASSKDCQLNLQNCLFPPLPPTPFSFLMNCTVALPQPPASSLTLQHNSLHWVPAPDCAHSRLLSSLPIRSPHYAEAQEKTKTSASGRGKASSTQHAKRSPRQQPSLRSWQQHPRGLSRMPEFPGRGKWGPEGQSTTKLPIMASGPSGAKGRTSTPTPGNLAKPRHTDLRASG